MTEIYSIDQTTVVCKKDLAQLPLKSYIVLFRGACYLSQLL